MLRTSEIVSFFVGPSPFAISELAPGLLDGLGADLDRTRSAHDFGGGGGGEVSFDAAEEVVGEISDAACKDVIDERRVISEFASSCGV